ncbi:MAG: PAS domain S-box protein [Methylococcaceae bacterium]
MVQRSTVLKNIQIDTLISVGFKTLLLAVTYALLAEISLANFSLHNGNVSLVWPPSGLALAALLLYGKHYSVGVFLGALGANLWVDNSLGLSISIAGGNTLESLAGYWLLAHCRHFKPSLDSLHDYICLNVVGGLAATVAATLGSLALYGFNIIPSSVLISAIVNWWQGDVLGIILITPLLLIWHKWPRSWFVKYRFLEMLACFCLLALVNQILFQNLFADTFMVFVRGYWVFPFLSWAAVRFGRHGVSLVIVLTAGQALNGITHDFGFFANDFENTHLLNFWFYILILTIVGLILSLYIRERQNAILAAEAANNSLKESQAFVRAILDSVSDEIAAIDHKGFITMVNQSWQQFMRDNGFQSNEKSDVCSVGINYLDTCNTSSLADEESIQKDVYNGIKAVLDKQLPSFALEYPCETPKQILWFKMKVTPLNFDNQGAVIAHSDITEFKQNEEILKESEQRFRNIANAAPLLIWLAGTDKLCYWFSQGWLDFTGRSMEEEYGNGWAEGVHPEDFQRCLDYYVQNFDLRQAFSMEYRLKHHSGEYRWIHDHGMPRFDNKGEFVGYIGSCVDVDAIRAIQVELLKSQEMLNEAQHIAHLGSWDWNIIDGSATWSDEAAEIYVPDNKSIPPSFAVFQQSVHPDDLGKVLVTINAAIKNDLPYDVEHRVISKSKGIRTVHAQGKVQRDDNGKAFRMIGTVHDITERVLAEQLALSTQQQLIDMTAAVPGVVYQLILNSEGNGNYVFISKGVELLFMIPVADVYHNPHTITDLIVPDDLPSYQRSLIIAQKNMESWDHEYRVQTRSGQLKWIRNHATLQRQDNGDTLWNGILSDITELKKIEEDLRLAAHVFDFAQESIIITDANRNIVDVNKAFTQITGYERDEVLGKNPRILQSGHQNHDFYAAMWKTIHDQGSWSGELWNRKKSGEVYAVLLTVSTITNENNEIIHYLAISSDITYIKEHQQQLESIAHHDALTGLPNRLLLADRMQQSIAQAQRNNEMLCVCYLDLDGFKPINDELGHEAGDWVLIEVGHRISRTIRAGDTVARLGGDEFAILLNGINQQEEYLAMLDRLITCLSAPIQINHHSSFVGASIGVSLFPVHGHDHETLLRKADQAMYTAKHAGKNCFRLYQKGSLPLS